MIIYTLKNYYYTSYRKVYIYEWNGHTKWKMYEKCKTRLYTYFMTKRLKNNAPIYFFFYTE